MKKKYAKSESRNQLAAMGAALVILSLTAGTALAGSSTRATKQADLFAKGATRQIEIKWVAPQQLPSELHCPELAHSHTNWDRLNPELFRCPTVRSNHTVSLAIHRMNRNPGRPIMVMIHGVLSDYRTWEYIAPELIRDYEVWLVDLPGCGESDAPKPASIEPDGYSPTAMAERILNALQQRLDAEAGGSTRPVLLVGHSLGGTVCIRMLSAPEFREDYTGLIAQVKRVVLLAPSDLAINSVPVKFLPLLGLRGWMVDVARGLGIWEGKVRNLTKESYHHAEYATREQQQHFDHVLKDAAHRKAAQAMLLQFAQFDPKTMRPIWAEIDRLVEDYRNIPVPVLIVHGTWDETLSANMGHKLKNQIPTASLVEISGCGHGLTTERPVQCTDLIRQFMVNGEVHLVAESKMKLYRGPAVRDVAVHSQDTEAARKATHPAWPTPEGDIEVLGNFEKRDTVNPVAGESLQ